MRFVFDTSVLVDYLRSDGVDSIAADALFKAAEMGSVFVSQLSLMELWLPDKVSFSIRDAQRIQNIVLGLDAGEIVDELAEDLYENGYDLPSQPSQLSVEVRSPGKKWRVEWDQEQFDIRLDPNDVLTVFPHQRNKDEIRREIRRIREIPVQIIPCSARSQELALKILEYHLSTLGQKREQNPLIDGMLIATGITRRAYLVTNEIRKWGKIVRENSERNLPFPRIRVISPEQLVQEF